MHSNTDSEVTRLPTSSPTRSRRPPANHRRRPSRDSCHGKKTTSIHSTPALSPKGSPPPSNSSVGCHSRRSSSSRVSGSLEPRSRRFLPNNGWGRQRKDRYVIEGEGLLEDEEREKRLPRRCWFLEFVVGFIALFSLFSLILWVWVASKPQKPKIRRKVRSLKPGSRKILPNNRCGRQRKECYVIEEEGLLEDEEREKSLSRRCYFLIFVVGFIALFSLFSLILWDPQEPQIRMKSITFQEFKIQAGSGYSGVATEMITITSTVKMVYQNTGTFFGVHVTATPLDLSYFELPIGSGRMKKFYQSRKSQRSVDVTVMGNKVPLYGSGAGLTTSTGTTVLPVQLKLSFTVRSRAYFLGKLVKPKFNKKIDCNITFDPNKINAPISLKNSCTYD